MPRIHPNMNLTFALDPTWDTPQVRQEVKRSCSFVVGSFDFLDQAPTSEEGVTTGTVNTAGADVEDIPQNNLRMNISLHAPYWDANDDAAQANWPAFADWLQGKLAKVSNALTGINANRAMVGSEQLPFSWLELSMKGNGRVVVHLGCDSAVDPQTVAMLGDVRARLGSGDLGMGVRCVTLPSRTSMKCQLALALEAQGVSTPAQASQDTQEESSAAQAGEHDTATKEDCFACKTAEEDASQQEAPVTTELPDTSHVAMPTFEIDYGIWGVEYEDGTHAEFDVVAGELRHG